jgi:hypothetical protein
MQPTRFLSFLSLSSMLLTALPAQLQNVHGRVDNVSGSNPVRYELRCTTVPMVSSTLNLNLLQGVFQQFQVVNIGTTAAPILDVRSATPLARNFDMGNLRIGDDARWQVLGPVGALAFIAVDAGSNTGYHPFGAAGTWLLGPGAATIASGSIAGNGQFEIRFTVPPTAQPLVGSTFVGQGLFVNNGQPTICNAERKVVENR